jgi:hypothetical protein
VQLTRYLIALVALSACAFAKDKDKRMVPTLRWTHGQPNCAVRAGNDGHTYYDLAGGDFDVTLAVDRQELEKIHHRAKPMLGVALTFHFRGNGAFDVQQNRFTLEFVKHFQVVTSSLDPDEMVKGLQENVEDLTDEIERHQVKKHPEQKEAKETLLQGHLKDYTELMDFISTRALRPGTTLDPANSSITGWVFFSIKNKWIGPWRKPEQFILRLPAENLIVEFPFELPPKFGDIELLHRPGE